MIYTKGSVDFHSAYPGMYVPRSVGLRPARLTISPRELAAEILALSKMNWNQSVSTLGSPSPSRPPTRSSRS
jgi:hypothetical protein